MPVGKESIKRAAGARKKTTSKAAAAKKTEAAPVAAEAVVVPTEELMQAVEQPKEHRTYGIKDELPIYLL